jgi:mono/diheme cytochrome c family protein
MKTPSFRYRGRVLATVSGFLALSAAITPSSLDRNERSVWSGVYTDAQAERGREAFEASCAACHRADLSGRGPIPALRGADFTGSRHGGSVGDLYGVIRNTMPPGRAGTLSPEAYADVVAFLLRENAFPAGEGDLPHHEESLHLIRFDERVAESF